APGRPGRDVSGASVRGRREASVDGLPLRSGRVPVIGLLVRAFTHQQLGAAVRGGPTRRPRSSPTPGCSTLMTSAPNSPRSVAQTGAARNVARSSTVTPSSAAGRSVTALLDNWPARAVKVQVLESADPRQSMRLGVNRTD